jgi:hypothetical protein
MYLRVSYLYLSTRQPLLQPTLGELSLHRLHSLLLTVAMLEEYFLLPLPTHHNNNRHYEKRQAMQRRIYTDCTHTHTISCNNTTELTSASLQALSSKPCDTNLSKSTQVTHRKYTSHSIPLCTVLNCTVLRYTTPHTQTGHSS